MQDLVTRVNDHEEVKSFEETIPAGQGRIGVSQYWLAQATLSAIMFAPAGIVFGILYFFPHTPVGSGIVDLMFVLGIIGMLVLLVYLILSAGLIYRRLHDLNVSGHQTAIPLVLFAVISSYVPARTSILVPETFGQTYVWSPIGIAAQVVLGILVVVVLSWPGTKDSNRFGKPTIYRSIKSAVLSQR